MYFHIFAFLFSGFFLVSLILNTFFTTSLSMGNLFSFLLVSFCFLAVSILRIVLKSKVVISLLELVPFVFLSAHFIFNSIGRELSSHEALSFVSLCFIFTLLSGVVSLLWDKEQEKKEKQIVDYNELRRKKLKRVK